MLDLEGTDRFWKQLEQMRFVNSTQSWGLISDSSILSDEAIFMISWSGFRAFQESLKDLMNIILGLKLSEATIIRWKGTPHLKHMCGWQNDFIGTTNLARLGLSIKSTGYIGFRIRLKIEKKKVLWLQKPIVNVKWFKETHLWKDIMVKKYY